MTSPETPLIGVIILTKNEGIHIERAIRSIVEQRVRVLVIDSGSTDATRELAVALGATVIERPFRNYADQFQFGIDNFPWEVDWLVRLDADEFVEPGFVSELVSRIRECDSDVTAFVVKRKMYFLGRWIRYGGMHPLWMLRVWRQGMGRIEGRWMDEHILVREGTVARLQSSIVDDNRKGLGFFVEKHVGYSEREARDLGVQSTRTTDVGLVGQALMKRRLKGVYAGCPLLFRAFAFWAVRYFILFGFLDGYPGLIYHFLQCCWYRFLVDARLFEVAQVSATLQDSRGSQR
ncbi:MAG: glycosyltransferase family 2 protein [Acidobacteria bacterium]|nr:glycosyltransferase family 2 protein [Acidobacteriota bacterium]